MRKTLTKDEKASRVYVIIDVILVVASLAYSVFRFPMVATRVVQSIEDLIKSIVYYVSNIFEIYGAVEPSVTEIPAGMPSLLPIEFEEFKAKAEALWTALTSSENLSEFFEWFAKVVVTATPYAYLLALIAITFVLISYINLKMTGKTKCWEEEKEERAPSAPLRIYEKIERRIIIPPIERIKDYIDHVKKSRILKMTLILIWLYNLNVYTIALETLAYVFFFPIAASDALYDVKIYSQAVKLLIDVSMPIGFLPWWLKIYFAVKIIEKWRRSRGDKKIEKIDEANGKLLAENPGSILITGKPRAGKGETGIGMITKQEVEFRKKALSGMRECRIEFPEFPWDRLEKFMRQAIDRHVLYTKEGTRDFIDSLRYMNEHGEEIDEAVKDLFKYRLKNFCGYDYEDYTFGYDAKRHGDKFNNGIVMVRLYDTLIDYAQLYYLYDAPSSLIFSTQGVRVDFKRQTLGYFPKYDLNYLKRRPEELEEVSTYSHRKNYDSERLGRSVDPEDPIKNGYEISVSYDPEIDKERGNQNTNAGVKSSDNEVNPKNDMYGQEDKMHNHITTVRFDSYYRKIMDTQRSGALSSDLVEMALEFQIQESKEAKVQYPFFRTEKKIYEKMKGIYDEIEDGEKYTGKTRTLRAYLLRRVYTLAARRYTRLKNRYGTQEKVVKIINGQGGEVIQAKAKWTVIYRQVRSNRYATDGILGLYRKRVVHRSEGGMNDYPLFEGIRNTGEEFNETRSLFYSNFQKYFNGEYEAERQRLLLNKELKEREQAEKDKQGGEQKKR